MPDAPTQQPRPQLDRDPYDPMRSADLMLQTMYLWQAPMILGAVWWNHLMPGWPAHTAFGRHQVHHDAHAQLVVPEPIEQTGENLVA